jgi:hypothetical protein
MIENNDMKEAIDRIARTPDGLLLYRLLQKVLCGTVAAQSDHGALQINEGRRTLARDLMAYMAEGIADNDRTCVTFAVARPATVGADSGTSARRKYLASIPWNEPDPIFGDTSRPSPGSNGTGGTGST